MASEPTFRPTNRPTWHDGIRPRAPGKAASGMGSVKKETCPNPTPLIVCLYFRTNTRGVTLALMRRFGLRIAGMHRFCQPLALKQSNCSSPLLQPTYCLSGEPTAFVGACPSVPLALHPKTRKEKKKKKKKTKKQKRRRKKNSQLPTGRVSLFPSPPRRTAR